MEELSKKELEALFQQKVPKHKMPLRTKWQIKLHNSRLSAKHWINTQFFRLKMAHLRPALVPLTGLLFFWLFNLLSPSSVSKSKPISQKTTKNIEKNSGIEATLMDDGLGPMLSLAHLESFKSKQEAFHLWGGANQISNPFGRSAVFNFEDINL